MGLPAGVRGDLPGAAAWHAAPWRLGLALFLVVGHEVAEPSVDSFVTEMTGEKDTSGKAAPSGERETSRGMFFVRYILPGLIILSGLLLGLLDGRELAWEAGALLMSAGLSVYLLNFLFRLGVRGDKVRDREEAAREHFDRTGRWPGE